MDQEQLLLPAGYTPAFVARSKKFALATQAQASQDSPFNACVDGEAAAASRDEAVVLLGAEMRVRAWSRGAERLYGLDAATVLNRRFDHLVTSGRIRSYGGAGPSWVSQSLDVSSGPAIHQVLETGREVAVRVSMVDLTSTTGNDACALIIRDDSEEMLSVAAREERLRFATLLAELSSRFTALHEDQIDGEIERWLGRLVEMLGMDRSSFAQVTPSGEITVTHTYAVPGIEAYPKGPAHGALPWLIGEFEAGRVVALSRIPDDLPAEAVEERRYFCDAGMTAGIGIPVSVGGRLVCILTVGTFRGPREWSADIVS